MPSGELRESELATTCAGFSDLDAAIVVFVVVPVVVVVVVWLEELVVVVVIVVVAVVVVAAVAVVVAVVVVASQELVGQLKEVTQHATPQRLVDQPGATVGSLQSAPHPR